MCSLMKKNQFTTGVAPELVSVQTEPSFRLVNSTEFPSLVLCLEF